MGNLLSEYLIEEMYNFECKKLREVADHMVRAGENID
jgi:hypothetical protein